MGKIKLYRHTYKRERFNRSPVYIQSDWTSDDLINYIHSCRLTEEELEEKKIIFVGTEQKEIIVNEIESLLEGK